MTSRRSPLLVRAAWVASACALVAGCDLREPLPFEPAGPAAAPDPARAGPFPVGVRTVPLVDPDRGDRETGRPVVTELWYPAAESARGGAGASYDLLSQFNEAQRSQLGSTEVEPIRTAAVRDAPPRRDRGAFPLVLFSHGMGGVRWQSTYLTVLLASHGYVVAAPDHHGHTLYDSNHGSFISQGEAIEARPADIRFVLDHLLALPPGDALRGLVDPERVGMAGHSFGGLTTLRTAALDPRLKAIVPQAPPSIALAGLLLEAPIELRIPVHLQAARADTITTWEADTVPTWEALKGPRLLLDVTGGGHFTFSDYCAFVGLEVEVTIDGMSLRESLQDGCGPSAPPPETVLPALNHFAVGFFNAVLRGSEGSWALLDQENAEKLAPGALQVSVERQR